MKKYISLIICALQSLFTSSVDKSDRFWRFEGEIVDMKFPRMELLNPAINTAIDSLSEVLRDPRKYAQWYRFRNSHKKTSLQDFYDTREYFLLNEIKDPIYGNQRTYVYATALANDSYPMPIRECDLADLELGIYEYKGKGYVIKICNDNSFREIPDSVEIPVQIEPDNSFLTNWDRPNTNKQIFPVVLLGNAAYRFGNDIKEWHYEQIGDNLIFRNKYSITYSTTSPAYSGSPYYPPYKSALQKIKIKEVDYTLSHVKPTKNLAEKKITVLSHNFKYPNTLITYSWYYDYMSQAGYNWPVICHKEHFFVAEVYYDATGLQYVQISNIDKNKAQKLYSVSENYALLEWNTEPMPKEDKQLTGKKWLFVPRALMPVDNMRTDSIQLDFNEIISPRHNFIYCFIDEILSPTPRVSVISNEYFDDFYKLLQFEE